MRLYEVSLLIGILIVGGAAVLGFVSYEVFRMKQDNVVEETAEEVIKKVSGVEIDLSPESKEKKAKNGLR